MKSFPTRLGRLFFGVTLYGIGIFLTIQAYVGLAPWEAFTIGLSLHTALSFGTLSILIGLTLLVVDVLLGEKIGIGTIVNCVGVGLVVDAADLSGLVPRMDSFPVGVAMLLAGLTTICFASFYYIGSGFGCGPRDALMVALGKRLPRTPIGLVRGGIEGTVLTIGWLLGAKVGLGTVIAVFGIGFILQAVFKILKFDVKAVEHENLGHTLARLRNRRPLADEPRS